MPTRIIHMQSTDDLRTTAEKVFATLAVEEYAERDSEHYPGGTYYLGCLGDMKFTVAEESDEGWEDFQYWLVLSTPSSSTMPIDDVLEAMLVELIRAGFCPGQELDAKKTTIERALYSLNSNDQLQMKRETRPMVLQN